MKLIEASKTNKQTNETDQRKQTKQTRTRTRTLNVCEGPRFQKVLLLEVAQDLHHAGLDRGRPGVEMDVWVLGGLVGRGDPGEVYQKKKRKEEEKEVRTKNKEVRTKNKEQRAKE